VDPLGSAEHTVGTTALEQIPATDWPNVRFTSFCFAFTYILGAPVEDTLPWATIQGRVVRPSRTVDSK
jgi:hypothetical protein